MQSFLEDVADYVLNNYPEQAGNICIVTPNRRAGLFLRKHFSAKVTKTTWSPAFLSIEDFVNRISGCQVADNLSLMFHFYEVYKNLEGENSESIDNFLRWGSILLHDFDELDANLENPYALFSYLQDLKYIETWNPDGTKLSEFQKNYLSFFKKFEVWHRALHAHLENHSLAYQGLSYRKAATRLKTSTSQLPWGKIIFAGFNALNQAEESIINSLIKAGLAEFICDSDPYYEKNQQHEAGQFIRKYRGKWLKPHNEQKASWFSKQKKISVLGIALNLNQAQLAGNLLENNQQLSLNEKTAIVLANENLLVPVLNALPERATSVNVTMGYPLAKTNLFGFFEALLQLFLTAHRLKKTGDGSKTWFYYKDLLRFFSNSCASLFWGNSNAQKKLDQLLQKISLSNRTFYRAEDLFDLYPPDSDFKKVFYFLSENWAEQIELIIPALRKICDRLDQAFRQEAGDGHESLQKSPFFIDFESLYYFGRIFTRIESLTQKTSAIKKIDALWLIIKQVAAETRLAFSGEPLEGLQVMGVLETRNLDFQNVVLLSANEDVLPKSKANNSFIPFEVKRKFGLQVHSDKDAVFAYHFYRLLQRAENISLIYNTESGGMGSGEKSRFITQLLHELPAFNPQLKINTELVSLSPAIKTGQQGISIEKTPEVVERLKQMANSGFSPSALNLYIRCPLRFYLEKAARFREAEEVEETIDASTLGNVVHGVLEELYSPYQGKVLQPDQIKAMHERVHQLAMQQFAMHYPEGDINRGKNLLLFSLAKRYVQKFLEMEEAQTQMDQLRGALLTILKTEATLKGNISLSLDGLDININIRGKTDRIDKLGNTIRVIDYKTGKVELKDLKVDELEKIIEDPKYEKAFQLLAYTWLYQKENPTDTNVESGIFSMRNLKAGFLKSSFGGSPQGDAKDILSSFEDELKLLLGRIMKPGQPFSQTEKNENCKYCPFQALCGRFESNDNF
jgi:CRISPR/Cas system-associated exonuclease Cas4 (RecB family)